MAPNSAVLADLPFLLLRVVDWVDLLALDRVLVAEALAVEPLVFSSVLVADWLFDWLFDGYLAGCLLGCR